MASPAPEPGNRLLGFTRYARESSAEVFHELQCARSVSVFLYRIGQPSSEASGRATITRGQLIPLVAGLWAPRMGAAQKRS